MTDWQPPQFGLQTPRFDARTEFTHPTGFAAFMRGIRDGVEVEWDISAVPGAAPELAEPSSLTSCLVDIVVGRLS